LTSGAIAFEALRRKGANVAVRAIPELDHKAISELASQGFDLYLFTDLASALVKELGGAFGPRFLVLDHHQLAEEDMKSPGVVNAWQFGYDGGREACSSTMAYFFAKALDLDNADLSYLAVVGSLADRQDGGQGRSLTGLNKEALADAEAAGLVSANRDMLFTGRETRPVHESIALTSTPFLPGLSGSKDAVLAALVKAEVPVKDGAVWRTISELSPEEKGKVTEVIAEAIAPGGGATDAIASLIGEVYTVKNEDPFTPLRDAREFGTFLNACGRMGATGVGISICLGDRGDALKTGMKTLAEYRLNINKAIQGVMGEPERMEPHGSVVLVRGDGVVDERLLGPVTSIITSSPAYSDKVVVARTASGEAELKISSRIGDRFTGTVNLGLVMREAAEAVKGVGGGHNMAAGAKIPASEGDAFAKLVLEKIQA
jgi:single-stranded-DNA-specific exonuclease